MQPSVTIHSQQIQLADRTQPLVNKLYTQTPPHPTTQRLGIRLLIVILLDIQIHPLVRVLYILTLQVMRITLLAFKPYFPIQLVVLILQQEEIPYILILLVKKTQRLVVILYTITQQGLTTQRQVVKHYTQTPPPPTTRQWGIRQHTHLQQPQT